MYINKRDAVQIAPSGAFFTELSGIDCSNPLIGTACGDLGFDPADGPVDIYVAKRNVEGGPRHYDTDTTQFRIVGGVEGKIDQDADWTYNAYYLYGQTNSDGVGINDFLSDRIVQGILGCPAGSFAGCLPYRVFVPGGVTSAAAAALTGTSLNVTKTETTRSLPMCRVRSALACRGRTTRRSRWQWVAYTPPTSTRSTPTARVRLAISQVPVDPRFPSPARSASTSCSARPASRCYRGAGFLKSFDSDLGYRISNYNLAGRAETFKVGFTADMGMVKARGGYNRAIRAPGINALFAGQQIALFSGTDPCAGPTPAFTAAQCANTGVSAARYGLVPNSSAGQYNQFIGGNLNLKPEKADTYTLGFVVTPIDELRVSLDYYDIAIKDTISTIGAQTILDQCGLTGNATLCSLVHRNPASGDLWRGSDPNTSGLVTNLTSNFGEINFRGLDLSAFYRWDMLGGRMSASFQGNYLLEQQIAPLAPASDSATYDCAGKINVQCQSPEWRHIANLRYSREWGSVNLRWRYFGEMDYVDSLSGLPLSTDKLLCSTSGGTTSGFTSCLGDGKLGAYNYLDLSGSLAVGSWGELTIGVNNIADKEPPLTGNTLAANGNAPGGYDQAGRYFFSSFTVRF